MVIMNKVFLYLFMLLFTSCASLRHDRMEEVLATAVMEKIDSRNYTIDVFPVFAYKSLSAEFLHAYIQVSGDTLIAFTKSEIPVDESGNYPNDFVKQMPRYKIYDYKQVEGRKGSIEVSFRFDWLYSGNNAQVSALYPENLIPVRYKFVVERSGNVRIYRDHSAFWGRVRL